MEELYRTAHDIRPSTSAWMVLLAVEQRLNAVITEILRGSDEMVCR